MPADSQVRIWTYGPDHITLSYAQVRVHYSPQGERLRDRLGLIHRIAPSLPRYPTGLTISILPAELTRLNDDQENPKSVLAWLDHHFRVQSEVIVFVKGDTLRDDGVALSRYLAYKAHIDELPAEYFGTLPVIGTGPELIDVTLSVHEDGSFSDFDSLGSYSAYTPARPGTE